MMKKNGKRANKKLDALLSSDSLKKPYIRKWGNHFDRKYTPQEIERIADEMIRWFGVKKNLWLKDFSTAMMFNKENISYFEKNSKYFADCLAIAKQMQESKLVEMGIKKGAFAGAMPIFALKNVAGWRDRMDVTSGNEPITAVEVTIRKSKK